MKFTKKRVFGLDVIRAIAILLVLCSHSTLLIAPNSSSSIVFAIKFFGTIGVDVFFVLSGFLIGAILLKQIELEQTTLKNIFHFWVRRWFRTLPNYYLILIINIGLAYFLFKSTNINFLNYFLFLQNFKTAQPDFFTESWSLSIEEFAYVFMPALMLLFVVLKRKITAKLFLQLSLVCILIITLNRIYFDLNLSETTAEWSASLRKVVIFRLDSIYYGFIAAYIFKYMPSNWEKYRYMSAFAGGLLFLLMHFYIFYTGIKPNIEYTFFNVFYLPLLSLSILLLFPVLYQIKIKGFLNTIITKISLWSYSLYLVNYSIVLLTMQYFIKIDDLSLITNVFCLLVFWIISFILAFLLYTFYEIPFTKLRDSKFIRKRFE